MLTLLDHLEELLEPANDTNPDEDLETLEQYLNEKELTQ